MSPRTLIAALVLLSSVGTIAGAGGGKFELTVIDRKTGRPIPCRMHLANAAGKPRKVTKLPFWHDHFVMPGRVTLELPRGNYTFQIERGLEYLVRSGHFRINDFADDRQTIDLGRFIDMSAEGWWSGDLGVFRPAKDIELLMAADDLHVAELITWPEGRERLGGKPVRQPLVCFDENRCCHLLAGRWTTPGAELLLLNLDAPPAATADGDADYPPLLERLAAAREKGNLWVDATKPYWWDLPMLVAHGQIDSIQVAHDRIGRASSIADEGQGRPRDRIRWPNPWGNAQWSQHVYFQLLECGLRIPPTAGSGSGEAPNPVGHNRVYVHLDGPFSYQQWWKNLRAGQVFVTNGPLVQPKVHGQLPGYVFQAQRGQKVDLEIGLTLSTREPISYLEIVKNGRVEHSIRFADYAAAGKLPKVEFDTSGWFLVRAVTDLPKTYCFAMTGPYYVEIGYQRRISRGAAEFFLDWIVQRARQIKLADPDQQRQLLEYHRKARDFWQDVLSRANAE